MQKKKASDSIIFDIVLQLSFFVGFRGKYTAKWGVQIARMIFRHAPECVCMKPLCFAYG